MSITAILKWNCSICWETVKITVYLQNIFFPVLSLIHSLPGIYSIYFCTYWPYNLAFYQFLLTVLIFFMNFLFIQMIKMLTTSPLWTKWKQINNQYKAVTLWKCWFVMIQRINEHVNVCGMSITYTKFECFALSPDTSASTSCCWIAIYCWHYSSASFLKEIQPLRHGSFHQQQDGECNTAVLSEVEQPSIQFACCVRRAPPQWSIYRCDTGLWGWYFCQVPQDGIGSMLILFPIPLHWAPM